ncbi:MAG: hypothetical protein IJT24_02835 [Lachnospiraceae bacterium]|nr:hypothetical protein [Lachnospiraceae bacterium]
MTYCPKCDIIIRGKKLCCPLCQGKTAEAPEGCELPEMAAVEAFPVIEHRISSVTVFKIMTFLFLTLEICFAAVHWLLGPDALWVSLVMLGILVGWLDILVVLYVRSNIIKLLTVEGYVAIAVDIFIDHMTDMHGWSFAWVVPSILFALGLLTLIIALVTRLRTSEYVQYIALNAGASLLQFIPIRLGLNPISLPAIVVAACYLILMAGVLVFQYNDLKTALGRRFNF